ncbi:hypothetical protein P7K49_002318 [Saguinus oedipus]|uniref:Uncharacterized protein n=1 Tax=Saguinus oedipus TaxID=9490 RepID=A0ABQ9WH17_SAGOE|nr:hypothetical protein P7K49_002318 [Saguinus oedipus]
MSFSGASRISREWSSSSSVHACEPPSSITPAPPNTHSPKLLVRFLSINNALTVNLCSPSSSPVDDSEECTLGREEEEVASDTENGPASARSMLVKRLAPYTPARSTFPKAPCPVVVLQDLILEDIEDDEMPPDMVLQDLILEDIEDDEMPPDMRPVSGVSDQLRPDSRCPVEVLQDLILEDIEDDEMSPDMDLILEDIEDDEMPPDMTSVVMDSSDQSVEFLANGGLIDNVSPVEVLQDLILEDIEDDEMSPDMVLQDLILEDIEDDEMPPDMHQGEWSSSSSIHACPVEVLQDLILEDIEDDEMPPDMTSVVMDSSDQSVEFLANGGLIDNVSPVEVIQDLILEEIEKYEVLRDLDTVRAPHYLYRVCRATPFHWVQAHPCWNPSGPLDTADVVLTLLSPADAQEVTVNVW